jgi:hypothetical protein
MSNYLNYLQVYDFPSKIRIGEPTDDGWVVGDLEGGYDCYISAGVSTVDSFSRDFIAKHCGLNEYNSFAFDGGVKAYPHEYTRNISFINKSIGPTETATTTTLRTLLGRHKEVFVKMDIEGGEYPWLLSISNEQLGNIKQLVIELHGIHDNSWGCLHEIKEICFARLAHTHYLVHVHGNSWGTIGQTGMPDTVEFTYINKRYFETAGLGQPALNTLPLPVAGLDYSNNAVIEDIDMNYWPFRVMGGSGSSKERVVVTLSTIPTRIHNIDRSIQTMLAQTRRPDDIIVFIPTAYKRFKETISDDTLAALNDKYKVAPARIRFIRIANDLGPISKLLPILDVADVGPDDLIITIDDDHEYWNELIAHLLRYHKSFPNSALAINGWGYNYVNDTFSLYCYLDKYINYLRAAPVLEGFSGILFKRSFFAEDMKEFVTAADKFFVDDVVISAYLAKRGIKRAVIPYGVGNFCKSSFEERNSPDSISCIQSFRNMNDAAVRYFTEAGVKL